MIYVSEKAQVVIADYFKERGETSPIRVYLAEGG